MHQLSEAQLSAVFGASEGIYFYADVGYEFNCSSASQTCVDTFLSYVEKLPPNSTIPAASFDDVLDNCGGPGGLLNIFPCLDPVIERVRIDNR